MMIIIITVSSVWTTGTSWGGGGGADSDCPLEGDGCPSSLQEYLDICFPVRPVGLAAAAPLSSYTHYLSTWTLSQALVLRGRCSGQSEASPEKTPPTSKRTPPLASPLSASSSTPELFGSAPLSPASTRRAEEGGVVLEDTSEGLLCSQGFIIAEGHASSDPASPQGKRRKRPLKEGDEKEADRESVAVVGSWGPTTVLTHCSQQGARYTVLVAVVHPCHLKEVKVGEGGPWWVGDKGWRLSGKGLRRASTGTVGSPLVVPEGHREHFLLYNVLYKSRHQIFSTD